MNRPELTVFLPADRYETIADVVGCLAAQEAPERLELLVVTDRDPAPIEAALPRGVFAAVRAIRVPDLRSLATARAAAVREAAAPLLAIGETHAYPEAGWADALIAAHRGPWAVVGPSMECALPADPRVWAGLLMDYGPCVGLRRSAPMHDVPAHNGCYKRSVLLGLGDRLEEALSSDQVLNERIRAAGGRLYLESRARTRHLNVTRLRPYLRERFHAGRAYAVARSQGWSPRRRLAYALASPLIPAVRALRIAGYLRRMGRLRSLGPRLVPALLLGLPVSAAGEAAGYCFGTGRSVDALNEFELHRTAYAGPPLLPTAEAQA